MNLLLIIPPQLLHQLEGIHVAGTGASDLEFTQQYFHCKIRRCQALTPKHNQGFKSEDFPTIQIPLKPQHSIDFQSLMHTSAVLIIYCVYYDYYYYYYCDVFH